MGGGGSVTHFWDKMKHPVKIKEVILDFITSHLSFKYHGSSQITGISCPYNNKSCHIYYFQDAIWQTTTYYVMDVILLYIDHNLFKY